MMEITAVLIASILIVCVYLWFRRSDDKYPPQPPGSLPFLGHLFTLEEDPRPQFKKWHKELGDIFSYKVTGTLLIVLNGYDLIKEVLVKRANNFSDRAPFFVDKLLGLEHKGITFSSGKAWKEQRSVAISILRSFGMGNNVLNQIIQEEITHFIGLITDLKGQPTDMRINTNMAMGNITCTLMFGRRFDYDDATFQRLMGNFYEFLRGFNKSEAVHYFPCLANLPGDIFEAKRVTKVAQDILDIIANKLIKNTKGETNVDSECNNFVMAYLAEREKRLRDGQATTMDEENLAKIVFDLLLAGSDTTASALLWCMLYAINFPEVQEKIFQEIENEIGLERVPISKDRTKLVYLNAFIAEVTRLASVVALSFSHLCSADTIVNGYKIPKDSIVIPNLDSIMYDKKIWGNDVMSLKPERFINQEGKLQIPEQLIPFGIGRRVCIGEGMASTAIFMMLATLFQKFKLLPKDIDSPPPIKYIFSTDVSPIRFDVCFIDRQGN